MKREVIGILAIFCSALVFAADTELNFYRPLTESPKQVPMTVVAQKAGTCARQSELIKREDAWSCVAEGKVYDPCFVQPYGTHREAICPESPWSQQGIKITVAAPLDNRRHEILDMSRTLPWAIELSTGEKCKAVESNRQYDGLPVHYQCEGNTELIGHVQRCNEPWKMLQHAANGVDTVDIAKAWF